jgi:predicted nucleic acid-binding protein
MASYFFDSSALVKNYAAEAGTAWVHQTLNDDLQNNIYVGAITKVEVIAAIQRRAKGGSISEVDAQHASQQFKLDFEELIIINISDTIINTAVFFAEKYRLRGYDAVQLSVAQNVAKRIKQTYDENLILVTSDRALLEAALDQGLTIINPTTET